MNQNYSGLEVRCATDGSYYTQQEFIEYFGGSKEWVEAADPRPALTMADVLAVSSFGPAPIPAVSSLFGSMDVSGETETETGTAFLGYEQQRVRESKAFWSSPSLEEAIVAKKIERANASETVRQELMDYENSISTALAATFR